MRHKSGLAGIACIVLPAFALLAGCQDGPSNSTAVQGGANAVAFVSVKSVSPSVGKSSAASSPSAATDPVTISGNPARTVDVGARYTFQSASASMNQARLIFAIQNLPHWANFNSATGELSGSPTPTDIGASKEISISASDGTTTASLAPFTITVVKDQITQVALSWIAPNATLNASALDLAGFRIYYGTDPSALTNVVELDDPSLIQYAIPGLASGDWYFAITAYDGNHVESSLSGIVAITI